MLDQTIKEKSRYSFFTITSFGVFFILICLLTNSIYSYGVDIANLDRDISISIPVVDNVPETKESKKSEIKNTDVKNTIRYNFENIEDTPKLIPEIKTVKNEGISRPKNSTFKLTNDKTFTTEGSIGSEYGRENNAEVGSGLIRKDSINKSEEEITNNLPPPSPPLLLTVKKPEEKVVPIKKTLGVITGKAVNLPKPIYSKAAQAVRASGTVSVLVTINKSGNVILAKATNGHPLLKVEAEKAALNAKFSPTLLSNEAVEVIGIIQYNFIGN